MQNYFGVTPRVCTLMGGEKKFNIRARFETKYSWCNKSAVNGCVCVCEILCAKRSVLLTF